MNTNLKINSLVYLKRQQAGVIGLQCYVNLVYTIYDLSSVKIDL